MKNTGFKFSSELLKWYDISGRDLPWRVKNYGGMQNQFADPYHVWLSEIMLQQTQVVTVMQYHKKFVEKWPTVFDLANANQDDVLTAWAGLGYYARARNLHKCAKIVAFDYLGVFPYDESELLKLPGVGAYTAAAIAAIAFNQKANVVDGNIERIFSRVAKLENEFPKAKNKLYEIAEQFLAEKRHGDYAQALMDLGATICKPKKPDCKSCPISGFCTLAFNEMVENYPKKTPKKAKKQLKAHIFWVEKTKKTSILVENQQKTSIKTHILVQKRDETGLLASMMEFPSTQWLADLPEYLSSGYLGEVVHIFTHIKLTLSVWAMSETEFNNQTVHDLSIDIKPYKKWVEVGELNDIALPTLMSKVAKLAMKQKKEPHLL